MVTVYSAANMNLYLSINGHGKNIIMRNICSRSNNYYMYSYTEYPGSFEYIYIPNYNQMLLLVLHIAINLHILQIIIIILLNEQYTGFF